MSYERMNDAWREHLQARARAAVKALVKRGFDARYAATAEDAVNETLALIEPGTAVGCGGSVTVRQLGLLERMAAAGIEVVTHEGLDPLGSLAARKRAAACHNYVSSSNAVTLEGELVNVDGIGNRLVGITFGPARVIIVAGANKVVEDLPAALARIRSAAAPANARRLGLKVPCAEGGQCRDCSSDMNICRVTAITHRPPGLTDVKVIMVGEELGY